MDLWNLHNLSALNPSLKPHSWRDIPFSQSIFRAKDRRTTRQVRYGQHTDELDAFDLLDKQAKENPKKEKARKGKRSSQKQPQERAGKGKLQVVSREEAARQARRTAALANVEEGKGKQKEEGEVPVE